MLEFPGGLAVKDLLFLLLRLRLLLWYKFDSWPGNIPMPRAQPKGEKKVELGISTVAEWINGTVWPLWRCKFNPWSGNFHMPRLWREKKVDPKNYHLQIRNSQRNYFLKGEIVIKVQFWIFVSSGREGGGRWGKVYSWCTFMANTVISKVGSGVTNIHFIIIFHNLQVFHILP